MGEDELIQLLGLAQADERHFYGVYRGYPIALTLLGPGRADTEAATGHSEVWGERLTADQVPSGLLFQIRHPLTTATLRDVGPYNWDDQLRPLIEAGDVQVTVEERLTFLEIYDIQSAERAGGVQRLLDAVLDTLAAAGVTNPDDLCHYCRRQHVEAVRFMEGRVVQICDECLALHSASARRATELDPSGVLATIGLGAVGSLVGGAVWLGLWVAYDAVLSWLAGNREGWVVVPHIILIVAIVLMGGLVGGPVAWLIGKVPRRGDVFAAFVAFMCAMVGIAVGELGYSTWLVCREFHTLSLLGGVRVLPLLWTSVGFLHIFHRVLVAVLAVYFAVYYARPRRARLVL